MKAFVDDDHILLRKTLQRSGHRMELRASDKSAFDIHTPSPHSEARSATSLAVPMWASAAAQTLEAWPAK